MNIKTQEISMSILKDKGVKLFIKRIDQSHEYISGNKLYKLKYNLLEAKRQAQSTLLTFGGAYSNHIAATACSAKESGFKSIGVIRGEECFPLNHTLNFAKEQGMEIYYLNRDRYRLKNTDEFICELKQKFGDFYLIPEGGSNSLGIRGASEIIDSNDVQDFICCSVGTGATISGIIRSADGRQKVIGFPAIKGFTQLESDISCWSNRSNWELINNYVCGGYARINKALLDIIYTFYETYNIPLDAVYTGKMMLGILDLVFKDYFPRGSSILAIHTGGVQGNKGMVERLGIKLPS
ncbi:MAG: 1-aminocyclopropane-1-carboxylate deaminase [Flavobacteriales bacterium]|nr:1-aminocyclopropane-1-carboxylate deaminase [Flavobacteriales bacterium]|tara:strand:+ start:7072 stop:7956 length:885 start_codon:yes stop_codon:yes gene_type:complete